VIIFVGGMRSTLIPICGTARRFAPSCGALAELDSIEMKITLLPLSKRGFGGIPSP